MRSVRRILVAVKDPKPRSVPAVTKGAQLAKAFGAELELFHSISSSLYIDAYGLADGIVDIERSTRTRRAAHRSYRSARANPGNASSTFASTLRGTVHAVYAYIPPGALPYTTMPPSAVEQLEAQTAAEAQGKFVAKVQSKSRGVRYAVAPVMQGLY